MVIKLSFYDWCKEHNNDKLLKEWDIDKNQKKHDEDIFNRSLKIHPAEPTEISWSSSLKVYWKCSRGHESYLSPNERHTRRDGTYSACDKCANETRTKKKRQTRASKNNLAQNVPQAIEEWVSSENGLTPFDVSCHSKEMVHWKCKKGHEFDKRVTDRVYRKDGIFLLHQCSECSRYARTSIAEQLIFFYIKQVFPDAINPYKGLGVELDIFIPSRRIAIEFDGSYQHKDRIKKDNQKDELCYAEGVTLYRFRPKVLPDTIYAKRITVDETNAGILSGLQYFFQVIKESAPKMDLDKDYDSILALFKDRVAISVTSTHLIEEWDKQTNNVDPEYVNVMDSKNAYYWICPTCHKSYLAVPYNRYVRKTGCKECSNKNAVRHNKRRIINVDTGEIFDSISAAENAYGKPGNTTISCCCRGRYKTAYGFHWKYLEV